MNKKNPFDTPKIENKNNLDSDAFDKECDRIFEERVCEMEWVWEPHTKIYSPKLKDLVVKLLDRDMTTRIGAKNGSEEILAHPVFQKNFVQEVQTGKYDHPIKPEVYNLNQDFDKHVIKISKALDCFTKQDEQVIAEGNYMFQDPIFGGIGED